MTPLGWGLTWFVSASWLNTMGNPKYEGGGADELDEEGGRLLL